MSGCKDERRAMQERAIQLGMPYGTARNKLNKLLVFQMAQALELTTCYRCKTEIEDADNLSVEHMKPWLHEPNAKELFFDLGNVAFSHHKCNSSATRKTHLNENPNSKIGGSGYKGVEVNGDRRKGRAKFRARFQGRTIAAGDDPRELALIYDIECEKVFGGKALTNKKLGLL